MLRSLYNSQYQAADLRFDACMIRVQISVVNLGQETKLYILITEMSVDVVELAWGSLGRKV